ncbi:MAG: hypothetical protein AB7N91_32530 [Candidatus Tectimicrobiota bacterium]
MAKAPSDQPAITTSAPNTNNENPSVDLFPGLVTAMRQGEPEARDDAFPSLESLRMAQDFEELGVRKHLSVIPVRKPNRQEWFMIRSGKEWRLDTAILTDEADREDYLVAPTLWSSVAPELKRVSLFLCMTRQHVLLFWPTRLPGTNRRASAWHTSALEGAAMATRAWTRMVPNMDLGAYDLYSATYSEAPEWPEDKTFHELLILAFKDRFIADESHPVIQRLRGLA